MENNELEKMRAQLATLNEKLEKESIVSDKHISEATKKHISEMQRKLLIRMDSRGCPDTFYLFVVISVFFTLVLGCYFIESLYLSENQKVES